MNYQTKLESVAKAEDLWDLLDHIAWTNVVKPALDDQIKTYSQMLINEAVGGTLPQGLTREHVAGRAHGMIWLTALFERILKNGEKALKDLNTQTGVNL